MKTKSKNIIFLFILISFLFCSCSHQEKKPLPKIPFDKGSMNKEIRFERLDRFNTYKYGDDIVFNVENLTENRVNFGKDYGMVLYANNGKEWVKVKDKLINMTQSDVIIGHGTDPYNVGGNIANPIIPFEKDQYDILVYVSGELIDDQNIPIRKVEAYEIFTLSK
jgi:hypothetical protein